MDESGVYIDNLSKLNGVKVKTIKMVADDGNLIELLCYRSHSEKPAKRKICNIGYSHIAFTVDDLEREYDKLKKQGINFNCPPQFSPDGKAKVVFCCDPEGNLIELVEELTRREGNE
jgi:catechol 2,3-dioxygenase-like lactoylglutathione lyase family enzyme